MTHSLKSKTIAEIVTKNYKAAAVFKKLGLDFCCGGKLRLEDACKKEFLNLTEVLHQLDLVMANNDNVTFHAENLELDDLVDHIVETHHHYIQEQTPEIESLLEKIVQVHGEKHPELKEVKRLFKSIKNELSLHMPKEENILFPYIKKMIEAKRNHKPIILTDFETIKNLIRVMEEEHVTVGDELKEIRGLTNNLTSPEDGCNTYRVTFAMLDEFENDLHRHIHLENNILFDKISFFEEKLLEVH